MPVSGQHLLISSENEEKMQHAKTDAFGRIRLIADGEEADATYLYGVSKGTRKAVMIGDQHVQSALLFSSEEGEDAESWRKSVAHALVREEESECKAYNIDTIKPELIDLSNAGDEDHKDILKEHFSQRNEINGLILPAHRIILLLTNKGRHQRPLRSASYKGTEGPSELKTNPVVGISRLNFHLPPPDNEPDSQQENIEAYGIIYTDSFDKLENGLYTFSIRDGNKYRDPESGGEVDYYTITAKVDFNIHTPMGDFAIVDARPVSLEESIFMQYPVEYEHLISALKNVVPYKGEQPTPFTEAQSVLKSYVDCAKVLKKRTSQAYSLFGMGDASGFLDEVVERVVEIDNNVKTAYEIYSQYKSVTENVNKLQELGKLSKNAGTFIDAADNVSDFSKMVKLGQAHKVFDTYGEDIFNALTRSGSRDDGIKILLGKDVNKKFEFLMKLDGVTPEMMTKTKLAPPSVIGRGLAAAAIALCAADIYMRFTNILKLSNNLETECKNLQEIAKSQVSAGIQTPSRDALVTIERFRQAADSCMQKKSEQEREIAMVAFDAALGVMAAIPATSFAAAFIVAVKAAGEACVAGVKTALEYVENNFAGSIIQQAYSKGKILNKLNKERDANFKLLCRLRNAADADQETIQRVVQIRMRAEAIRGLIALIQRLSCRIYFHDKPGGIDYKKFDEKLRKYRIDEYIKEYILGDGWLMPKRSSYLPVGLDQFWLYARGEVPDYESHSTVYDFNSATYTNEGCLGTKLEPGQDTPANAWKAEFHKYYPVHCMTAKDACKLSHIFSQNYAGALDSLRWTQIYWREKPSAAAEIGPNDGWKPLAERSEIDTEVQLRIVVAFDSQLDIRAVPISIRLNRIESFLKISKNIDGPIYKITCEPLHAGEGGLLDTPEEKELENKLGCVFFPFYTFGGEIYHGVKPLRFKNDAFDAIDPVQKKNTYNYTLKVGNEKSIIHFGSGIVDRKLNFNSGKEQGVFSASTISVNQNWKDFARETFEFQMDEEKEHVRRMLNSKTFLCSLSSETELPDIFPKTPYRGISGIFIQSGLNPSAGKFFPAGYWENERSYTNSPIRLGANLLRPGIPATLTVIIYTSEVNENEWAQSKSFMDAWARSGCSAVLEQSAFLRGGTKQN
ncbi:MAG: hypothetical protein ACOC4C_05690, partial [Fibrobacterota bacterium]